VNPYARLLAYVTAEGFERDILIESLRHQNRAYHGDIVVIKLIDEENESKRQQLLQQLQQQQQIKLNEEEKEKEKIEVEIIDDLENVEEELERKRKLKNNRRLGKVVGIFEEKHKETIVGYLKPKNGKNNFVSIRDSSAFFVPIDKKISACCYFTIKNIAENS